MKKDITMNISEQLGFSETLKKRHGILRGHVSVFVQDIKTKEVSLWDEDDNIIPISGYQFILLKIFGLNLDSTHNVDFEDPGMDTNLVIPDLNYDGKPTLGIGVDPTEYTTMDTDNSHNHFVQGFMVGNGGSGEDNITTKNTDYSFVNLRNPIPFRQTQTRLSSEIANDYLGQLRMGKSSFTKSYYIKRFSKRPNVIHSWWKDGQKWNYKDPVQFGDLGPHSINPSRNNRIETYVDINFTIDEDDCVGYFNHEGSTQTALLNELGLVAFDVLPGNRSIITRTYERLIRKFIELIMDNNRTFKCPECNAVIGKPPTTDQMLTASKYVRLLAMQIKTVFDNIPEIPGNNKNMISFVDLINDIVAMENEINEIFISTDNIISRGTDYKINDIVYATIAENSNAYFTVSKVNSQGEVLELICKNPMSLDEFTQTTKIYDFVNMDHMNTGSGLKGKIVIQTRSIGDESVLDWSYIQKRLIDGNGIAVQAFYNNDGSFIYFEDTFLDLLSDDGFIELSTDEAQRIKLVTYYTFKAIPLESNRRILINYRVYSN